MSSIPCVAEPAKALALLPSGYTPRRKHGWVDLPCGKRCWFARVPKRDENLRNYIEIMDAFGRDIPKRFQYILFWYAYHHPPSFAAHSLYPTACGLQSTGRPIVLAQPKSRRYLSPRTQKIA